LRKVKKILVLVAVIAGLLACESVNYVPPVTQQNGRCKKKGRVDVATLREGRTLLVHRFIEDRAPAALLHQINDSLKKIEASSIG
jgi:hypothetical protein